MQNSPSPHPPPAKKNPMASFQFQLLSYQTTSLIVSTILAHILNILVLAYHYSAKPKYWVSVTINLSRPQLLRASERSIQNYILLLQHRNILQPQISRGLAIIPLRPSITHKCCSYLPYSLRYPTHHLPSHPTLCHLLDN